MSSRRVIDDWATVERDLLTLVRRDEHGRRARHRVTHVGSGGRPDPDEG